MIALLLNSGLGSRMGDETREHPKCMTRISEAETIISWQVKCLERVGVTEAVVTTGHLSDMLEKYLLSLDTPIRFRFVHNPRYRETNYIYSVHLARALLAGQDVISLHGDLVMHPEVMHRLAASAESCVTVDSTLPLPEKDFKGRMAEGFICEVGVNVFGPDCIELQPAYLLKAAQTDRWLKEIAAFIEAGNDRVYAENAFNAAWREIPVRPLDVQGLLCAEIDNQADKEHVSQRFAKEVRA
ncbi:MAG: NTP transferase domain-containing protein [Clostridia bacterium]|nr:NTP transferase domain-containing protein [Clostridia bacterium]